ncbi:Mitochondrial outer membrane protein iml2 [Orbilia oligospora]|uniref:Mitochondrial outer membrane protein iml2 n=1 Tax=Orbilia oligospora TaxID=2813651 RepID=A0A7C8K278_ORBOL|nr:Mitochondrial outer membrane protein iml2 [Orbilia oligospora]
MEEKPKPVAEESMGEKPIPEEELPSKSQVESSVSATGKPESFPNGEANAETIITTSVANRIGSLSSLLFLGSSLFAIGCMGWFAFLWWGTVDNSLWHAIIIRDWAVRAISLPSSVFRMAVTLQASQCLSMLAALAIEKSIVPLPNLAAISMMRATPPSTTETFLNFIYPLIRNTPGIRQISTLSVVSLTSLIVLTSSILGFTSTILLSDVVVQPIPSESKEVNVTIDYIWNENGAGPDEIIYEARDFRYTPAQANSYWKTGPANFPAFAEYFVEAPVVPGIVDTGTTLRSFIPFSNADDRSRLRYYKGKAVVWDARVVCQKPQISGFRVYTDDSGNVDLAIGGTVRKTVSSDMIQNAQPEATAFFCGISDAISICQLPNSDIGSVGIHLEYYEWPPLAYGGGLKSEFSTADRKTRNGAAYLILNQTFGQSSFLDENPEWAEIGNAKGNQGVEITIVGTLCYTPLDVVDRDVEISRAQTQPETEFASYQVLADPERGFDGPFLGINAVKGIYTFEKVLPLLLPSEPNKGPESRGIFNLLPSEAGWAIPESEAVGSDGPWPSRTNLTRPDQLHFLADALHLKYRKPYALQFEDEGNYELYGNFSVSLSEFFSQLEVAYDIGSYIIGGKDWQQDLFSAVKDHPKGNVALALQSILTVIASNAYYNNLQLLPRQETVSVVTFQNVSSPGGPYGTRRGGEYSLKQQGLFSNRVKGRFPVGYSIVASVLCFQIILAAIILVRFLRETTLTRIGDPWQALAQVSTEEFEGLETILELSKRVDTDREAVAKEMKSLGVDETLVGVEQHDRSTKLIHRGGRGGAGEA